ncbi:hypothetical protein AcV7_002736 [Taiwanofungus camphoratus]|nr:hypothetical protein AcV7_002732 [Antrodia cinnamomea]KAI0941091.1 hypothetical protein AcV7_002736 [Antrodia cinnamomea]
MYSSLLPSRFQVAGKFTQPRRFVFSKYELSRVIAAAENPAPPAAHHGSLRCNGTFAVADLDEVSWPSRIWGPSRSCTRSFGSSSSNYPRACSKAYQGARYDHGCDVRYVLLTELFYFDPSSTTLHVYQPEQNTVKVMRTGFDCTSADVPSRYDVPSFQREETSSARFACSEGSLAIALGPIEYRPLPPVFPASEDPSVDSSSSPGHRAA